MADFFNDISGDKYTIEKKNNSFISFFTGANETESFMTYMPKLGAAVRTFASEAEGMGSTTIVKDSKALSKAVGAIADVLTYINSDDVEIEEREAWWKRAFVGDGETGSFISYIPELGKKVKEMGEDISGFGKGTIVEDAAAAKDAIEKFVTLLTDISTIVVMGLGDDGSDVTTLKARITDLGSMVSDIAVAISGFDSTTADADLAQFQNFVDEVIRIVTSLDGAEMPDMSGLTSAIDALRSLFTAKGADALTSENFLKGLDINKVSEKLGAFTSGLGDVISSNTETMASYTGSFNDAGSSLISAVSSGMSEGSDTSAVSTLCSKMVNVLTGHTSMFKTAGTNFGVGLGNGIGNTAVFVKNKAAYVAKQAVAAVKSAFDEHSPSKVAMGLGAFFSKGLGIGIEDNAGSAIRSSENMAESIIGNARNGLNALSAIIEDNMDADPVVRPVMDLSDVRSGARAINGMIPGSPNIFASGSLNKADEAASSMSRRRVNQNGNVGLTTGSGGSTLTEDNAVNLSGNNFYIRSENDIHLLASEIASLTRSQQRSLGGSF